MTSTSTQDNLRYTPLDEIDRIHDDLRKVFLSGKTRSIDFRKEQLIKLAYMIHDNVDQFLEAMEHDLGRPKQESVLDMSGIITEALWAHNHVDVWVQPDPLEKHPVYSSFSPVLHKEPKGVGLMITPFNFPIYTMRAIAGAIAAGCPVVLKPSELLPKTSALTEELFAKYLDPDAYRVVQGGVAETTRLLSKPWGHIYFVGSIPVGRVVATAAGKTLSPVTLELGGKNPCLVHSSATMDIAARRILWGRMVNGGQTCLPPDYIIVLDKDKDAFTTALLKAYEEFYGVNPKNSVSRLRVGKHWDRVVDLLKRTKGKIIAGGETIKEENYVAPTIVTDVDWDDSLMEDEIFGPVLPIITVTSFEVAFEKIRSFGEPLTAYAFHNDAQFASYARDNILSGTWAEQDVIIPFGCILTPLCGRGTSGMGRGYKGVHSFLEFTHMRPSYNVPESFDVAANLQVRYAPYTEERFNAAYKMFVPKIDVPRPAGI